MNASGAIVYFLNKNISDLITHAATVVRGNTSRNMLNVNCALLRPNAVLPQKGTAGSAGYDITSCISCVIQSRECKKIPTGISLDFPPNTFGRIADRSSVVLDLNLHVVGGIIDNDFIGEICVLIMNFGSRDVEVESGTRIAQIIFEQYVNIDRFNVVQQLTTTSTRAASGFGSTGRRWQI